MSINGPVDGEGKPYDPAATYWGMWVPEGFPHRVPPPHQVTFVHGDIWSKDAVYWMLWNPDLKGSFRFRLDRCFTSEQALLEHAP